MFTASFEKSFKKGFTMTFAICAFISFAISALTLPYIIRQAKLRGLYDSTGGRKIHTGKIPRLGGIAIFMGWGIGLGIALAVAAFLNPRAVSFHFRFLAVIGAGLVFHVVGLVDDLRTLRAYTKFALQCLVAFLVTMAGFKFDTVNLPFVNVSIRLGVFAIPLSVVWIVGVANAFNLIDGVDGLAGGVALIAAGTWALDSFKNNGFLASFMALSLVGATLGFLLYNVPPASVFMGDSGSLFLGFMIATMPLLGYAEPGMTGRASANLLSAIAVCIVPIVDTLAAMIRRWKRGVPVFSPDRMHVHHILLDLGMSKRGILAIFYSSTAAMGGIVLISEYLRTTAGIMLKLIGIAAFIVLYRRIQKAGRQIQDSNPAE